MKPLSEVPKTRIEFFFYFFQSFLAWMHCTTDGDVSAWAEFDMRQADRAHRRLVEE